MTAVPQHVDRHPKSGVLRYRRAFPQHLRGILKRAEFTKTLGAKTWSAAAKQTWAGIDAHFERIITKADAMLTERSGAGGVTQDPDELYETLSYLLSDAGEKAQRGRTAEERAKAAQDFESYRRELARLDGKKVVTFEEALAAWERRQGLNGKGLSKQRGSERQQLVRRVEALFPGTTLDEFQRAHARTLRDKMLGDGKAASTVKQALLILNSLRNAAVEDGLLDDSAPSPFIGIKVEGSAWTQDKSWPEESGQRDKGTFCLTAA
jgi:hypothetical protein